MLQQLGVAPSNTADAVTKAYVDAATTANDIADNIPGAPIGWYLGPQGVYSTGVASMTTGVWCLMPINIPYTQTYDAFATNLGTAQAGGTGTLVMLALFRDDGTGFPNTNSVVASANEVNSVTGRVITTFSAPVSIAKGLYWTGGLYYQGTAAPTTAPQLSCISGAIMNVPLLSSIAVGSSMRGLRTVAATYTGLPGSQLAASAFQTQTAASTPYIMLRRSA